MDAPRDNQDSPRAEARREPIDAAGDAAAVVSRDGLVIAWTRAAEELLGLPADAVVGTPGLRLLATPGDRARAAAVAERCRSGSGWSGRFPVRHREGHLLDVDVRVSPASASATRSATSSRPATGRPSGSPASPS